MVLSSVHLAYCAAYTGPVLTDDNEQILCYESHLLVRSDNLDMGESLPI